LANKHPLAECDGCPLLEEIYIPPEGPERADVVLLGQAGANEEAKLKRPFVGSAGRLLDKVCGAVGIDREASWVTNSVLCRVPAGGKVPVTAVRACRKRLLNELDTHHPKVIVAMGGVAYQALHDLDSQAGIMLVRGKVETYNEAYVVPTVHPAAMLYPGAQGMFVDFARDMEKAGRLLRGEKPPEPLDIVHAVIIDIATLGRWSHLVTEGSQLAMACDIETTGFDSREDSILCISFSWGKGLTAVVAGELHDDEQARSLLNFVFEHPKLRWIFHNGKFDTQFLRAAGLKARCEDDTMLASYALDERSTRDPGSGRTGGIGHGLKKLAAEYCAAPNYEAELRKYLPHKKASYADIPRDKLYKYAAYDAAYTRELAYVLGKLLRDEPGPQRFYREVLIPGAEAFSRVEEAGFALDTDFLVTEFEEKYFTDLQERERQMQEYVGIKHFNPRSPQQVAEIFFDRLKLPKVKGKGRSTDKEVLEVLAPRHEFPRMVQQYRGIHKEYSTYVVGLLESVREDGRIHATYLLHGSVSRTSCNEPNVQNIPRPPESRMRDAFIASPGNVLLQADYRQHEFRVMAVASGDEYLCERFRDPSWNIHADMARRVYGPDYTHTQYVWAKMIDFGVLYGRGDYSLSIQLDCTTIEAHHFIEEFFAPYPRVREKRAEVQHEAIVRGWIEALTGRRRRFGLITRMNVEDVRKQACNFISQGPASDTTVVSMANLLPPRSHDLWDMGVRVVQMGHDALIFDVPRNVLRDTAAIVVEVMERTPRELLRTDVPFFVDLSYGERWGGLIDLPKEA